MIVAGLLLIMIGLIVTWGPKIPWIGRLPGDIAIHRENVHIYVPITTCILLSLLLTLLFVVFRR